MRDPVSHNLSLLTPQLFLNMSISVCLLPPAGFYHHSTPGFISLSTCLPVSPLASLQSNLPTAAKVIFFFFKDTFIYFLAVVGLCCCTQAFSNDRKQGLLFIVVWGFSLQWLLLLQSTGSRQAGFGGCSEWALERWLSSCGARA